MDAGALIEPETWEGSIRGLAEPVMVSVAVDLVGQG
jgi:hypothetical protein